MGIESWPQPNNDVDKPNEENEEASKNQDNEANSASNNLEEKEKKQYEGESVPSLVDSIRLNKKTILQKEDIPEKWRDRLNGKKGHYYLKNISFLIEEIRFVDSEENIVEYKFDPSAIKSYIDKYSDEVGIISDRDRGEIWAAFEKELEEIGFTKCEKTEFPISNMIDTYIEDSDKRKNEEKNGEKNGEFNF